MVDGTGINVTKIIFLCSVKFILVGNFTLIALHFGFVCTESLMA